MKGSSMEWRPDTLAELYGPLLALFLCAVMYPFAVGGAETKNNA